MTSPESRSRITQRDIAKKLKISNATVSLALRNSPEIPEATRRRIQSVARRMGYQINSSASQLSYLKRNSKTPPIQAALAWVRLWPNRPLSHYAELDSYHQAAVACAEKFGYRLEEFVCDDDTPPKRLEAVLLARGIQGIIIAPAGRSAKPAEFVAASLAGFGWDHFSLVGVGRLPYLLVHRVTSDQVANMMMAFHEVRQRGYDRVGLIISHCYQWGVLFEAGYLMAQQRIEPALRLPLLCINVIDPPRNVADIAEWMRAHKPDAVLTDIAEVPAFLKQAGYRVPEDVGIAAMSVLDGNADAGVQQNSKEIGRVSALMLHSLILDNSRGIPAIQREILVKGSWVDGATLPDLTRKSALMKS